MSTIGIYGDSYADNNHRKFDQFRKQTGWANILEKKTGYKVHNYSLCGSNRYYTYKQLEKTLGKHDYNIIFHTYWCRQLYVDSVLQEHAWWLPIMEYDCPIPEYKEAITNNYKMFYDFEANKIAHLGFNIQIQKLIKDRNIQKDKLIHIFIDRGDENAALLDNDGSLCLTGFSKYDFDEIECLQETPKYKYFVGQDLRTCHLSPVNNERLANMFIDFLNGKQIDPSNVFLNGKNEEVIKGLDLLIEKYGKTTQR